MLSKAIFSLTLALFLAVPAMAEDTAIIYGAVSANGTPLAATLITAIGEATYTSRNAVTDDRGVYLMENLPRDEYMIRALAQPEGVYAPGEANVFVGEGTKKEVNFSLKKLGE